MSPITLLLPKSQAAAVAVAGAGAGAGVRPAGVTCSVVFRRLAGDGRLCGSSAAQSGSTEADAAGDGAAAVSVRRRHGAMVTAEGHRAARRVLGRGEFPVCLVVVLLKGSAVQKQAGSVFPLLN